MERVTFKQIFDEAYGEKEFDEKLVKKIKIFLGDLMNRNNEHVMFFGSNLTGPYALRFKTSDRNEWFVDIKDVDDLAIGKRIVKETGINKDWVRATDAFNMDCFYTIHRLMNSNLPDKVKHDGMVATSMVLNIKLLGSIMAAYFKYPVDERAAQEVYSRLSRKFYIKQFGNWRSVLEHRSEDMITPKPNNKNDWYQVLKDFDSLELIPQLISDVQGRLRSMIKYIWGIFEEVRNDDMKFNHTSMSIEVDGEKVLQDLKRDSDTYVHYIQKCVGDTPSFVKDELVTIVDAEMKTMPTKLLFDTLDHLVSRANKNDETVNDYLATVVEYTVDLIQSDRSSRRNLSDLSWLLNKVKLQTTAAKTKDQMVFKIRDLSDKLVKQSAKTKNPTVIATLRTGMTLYVVARTFSMQHYK